MDLGLSQNEIALQARARAFAREVVRPRAAAIDRDEQYPWDIVKALERGRLSRHDHAEGARRPGPLLPRRRAGDRGDGQVLHRHCAHRGRDQYGRDIDGDGLWQRGAEKACRPAGPGGRQARDLHHRTGGRLRHDRHDDPRRQTRRRLCHQRQRSTGSPAPASRACI